MNCHMHPARILIGGAFSVVALLASVLVALAQPAPGSARPGGPGEAGAGDPLVFVVPNRGNGPGPMMAPPLPANAPPPSSDPRNFDGVWFHSGRPVPQMVTDMFGYSTPYNALGKIVMARRVKSMRDGTPFINASAKCFPVGQPWNMDLNMPFHIFQSKERFDIIFEEYHGFWQIALDPAKAPEAGYMGSSTSHWDGDTLVVETIGFKEPLWLDVIGTPASKFAKLTSRIRKVKSDKWYLEVVNTVDDPTYYTRPWSWVRDYDWRPDMALYRDYNCELQTGAKDGVDPSLVQEPADD
jgi:hypothetical protein